MPFQGRGGADDQFLWEKEVERGNEFIAKISANSVFVYWTRALRAVAKGGVLVIRFHRKPVGIMGSPKILRDMLIGWRYGNSAGASSLALIWEELAMLADSARPTSAPSFCPRSISVRTQPRSISKFLHDLEATGGASVILYHRHLYAVLLPMALLARFRQDIRTQTFEWADQVLNWICQPETLYWN